jgi:hypothetical protein
MKKHLFISFTGLLTNLRIGKITLDMVKNGFVFIKGLNFILDYNEKEFNNQYHWWEVKEEIIKELKDILRSKLEDGTAISVLWSNDLEISESIDKLNHLLTTYNLNKIDFSDKYEKRNFTDSHPHACDVIEKANPELAVIWTGLR